MSAVALRRNPPSQLEQQHWRQHSKHKLYHGTMLVTRAEEWCVEAESPEQARELLQSGEGHRCHLGDCVQLEFERLLDEEH
jgi:hypothetical protein